MKRFYLLLLAASLALATGCDRTVDPIVDAGMEPAADGQPGPYVKGAFPDASTAVTDGELDGDGHPMVVLLVVDADSYPAFRCSATLLSPTVALTAAHCIVEDGYTVSGMRIFTESDVDNGDNNYPFAGPHSVEAASWHVHPAYDPLAYTLHDIGVVVLEGPGVSLDAYGVLPESGQLDALAIRRGLQNVSFTTVGYGLQRYNNHFLEGLRVRMVAYPQLVQINVPGQTGEGVVTLSNNAATGGTCFGDNGGPNFLGDSPVVAAVTSVQRNPNCAGLSGAVRVDRQDVLGFLNGYLE